VKIEKKIEEKTRENVELRGKKSFFRGFYSLIFGLFIYKSFENLTAQIAVWDFLKIEFLCFCCGNMFFLGRFKFSKALSQFK
jgi:hypothetical protein